MLQQSDATAIEKIYDLYSPVMFGIAMEVCGTEKEAEEVLISAFERIKSETFTYYDSGSICSLLINLTLQTAHEHLRQDYKITEQQMGNSVLLHQLLFREISLENYCRENKLTFLEAGRKMRKEFNHLRKEGPPGM